MSNEDRALHPGASRTRTPDLLWRCMALAAGPACGEPGPGPCGTRFGTIGVRLLQVRS